VFVEYSGRSVQMMSCRRSDGDQRRIEVGENAGEDDGERHVAGIGYRIPEKPLGAKGE
jgi:hypothetical protein